MDDLTDEEAIAAVYDGINALFAAHRDVAEPDECTAYLMPNPPAGPIYVFETFCNGAFKEEGHAPRKINTLRDAVNSTVRAVAKRFPDHASQQVIWRCPASVERYGKNLRLGMRLVATPLGI